MGDSTVSETMLTDEITEDTPSLEFLLSLWPVAESLATQLPVGDLITLSRTSVDLRASLHGQIPQGRMATDRPVKRSGLQPNVGQHQTPHWNHLKSISPFLCVNRVHTKGERLKPCVYCCRPICDACIVRDSFKKRNENTFKHRIRYYCKECWHGGRPAKDFRYPTKPQANPTEPTHTEGQGSETTLRTSDDEFCSCNLRQDGWLCIECKEHQNAGPPIPGDYRRQRDTTPHIVQCYGLDCMNEVDLNLPDKDRRRVCLWCHRPLKRQFGGEDRHAWNLKTIEVRAINAESRSRDIEEYNRKRMRDLRMSRREMRGGKQDDSDTNGKSQDNTLEFVRHLDTINYRAFLAQNECPSPDDVWKSKRGVWRYETKFLLAFGRCAQLPHFNLKDVDLFSVNQAIQDGVPRYARTNSIIRREIFAPDLKNNEGEEHDQQSEQQRRQRCEQKTVEKLISLKVRILHMYMDELTPASTSASFPTENEEEETQKAGRKEKGEKDVGGLSVPQIKTILFRQYGLIVGESFLSRAIKVWVRQIEKGDKKGSSSSSSSSLPSSSCSSSSPSLSSVTGDTITALSPAILGYRHQPILRGHRFLRGNLRPAFSSSSSLRPPFREITPNSEEASDMMAEPQPARDDNNNYNEDEDEDEILRDNEDTTEVSATIRGGGNDTINDDNDDDDDDDDHQSSTSALTPSRSSSPITHENIARAEEETMTTPTPPIREQYHSQEGQVQQSHLQSSSSSITTSITAESDPETSTDTGTDTTRVQTHPNLDDEVLQPPPPPPSLSTGVDTTMMTATATTPDDPPPYTAYS